jgi:DNA polymerase-3 subunit delta'
MTTPIATGAAVPTPSRHGGKDRPAELSFLDAQAKAELNALARSTPPAVLLLTASQHDLVLAVASTLGKVWVAEPLARDHDLHVAVPEGRWDIEQLRSLVLRPLQTVPIDRRVMIVDRVDELDDTSVDHLLKVLEEPTASTTFILLTSDLSALKATIRGRVGASVVLRPAPLEQRVNALVEGGVAQVDARRAVEASGDLVSLAPFLAANQALLDAAERVRALQGAVTSTPATAASNAAAEFDVLAGEYAKGFGSGERAVRAARRALVESWVGRVRADALESLRDGAHSGKVAAALAACDAALARLETHAPLIISLTALHVTVAELTRK